MKTFTKNGLVITKTGRLQIPCKFIDMNTNAEVGDAVAVVGYGSLINRSKIGVVSKTYYDTYPDGRISEFKQFEITTPSGTVLKEVFEQNIYKFDNGQYQDALDFKKEK